MVAGGDAPSDDDRAGASGERRAPPSPASPPTRRRGFLRAGGDVRDEARPAAERQVRPEPLQEHRDAVPEADQVQDVDEEPEDPRRPAAEVEPAQVGDRGGMAERGEAPLVPVTERPPRLAGEVAQHVLRRPPPHLHGGRRDAGDRLAVLLDSPRDRRPRRSRDDRARTGRVPPAPGQRGRAARPACAPAARPRPPHPTGRCAPGCALPKPRRRARRWRSRARRCAPRRRAASSCARAASDRSGGYGGRTRGVPSSRITRALAGEKCLKSRTRVVRAMSARAPASSTPVGPAPTTTKVSHSLRRSGSASRSAISKAVSRRLRISSASSIVFKPGAVRAHSGCPK